MRISDRVAARYQGSPLPTAHRKTAAFSPEDDGSGGVGLARNIPKGHEFDKRALKPLSKALWASTVALGHALTAYRHLSRLKSTTISPDGQMGGQGYVMKLGDMRHKLFEASEALSTISDTIYDEITAPHWKPKLAQLNEDDQDDISRFVEEAQGVMENPEGEAEEAEEAIETSKAKPKKLPGVEEDSSSLPTGSGPQSEPESKTPKVKIASAGIRPPGLTDRQWVHEFYTNRGAYALYSNSSIPVDELSGPRVNHLGPGTGTGLYGEFNQDTLPQDESSADGGGISRRDDTGEDYDYTSEYENEMPSTASSVTPMDTDTPTDADDFGIGYGAKGDGSSGYGNPSGEADDKGVWGPQSGLPGSPGQSSGDTTHLIVEDKLNPRQAGIATFEDLYSYARLPDSGPPARSDYFPGKKDNMVSVGTSELPASPRVEGIGGQSIMNTYYVNEDMDSEYERYDHTTKTLREPAGKHPGQDHQEPWSPDGESTR